MYVGCQQVFRQHQDWVGFQPPHSQDCLQQRQKLFSQKEKSIPLSKDCDKNGPFYLSKKKKKYTSWNQNDYQNIMKSLKFSTLIPKIRVPRRKKAVQLPLEHSETTQAAFCKFINVSHEVEEEFKHVRYYKEVNNVRFHNIKVT